MTSFKEHRYGSTTALNNVSIPVPSGQMVGLIGSDGVGKSRLLGCFRSSFSLYIVEGMARELGVLPDFEAVRSVLSLEQQYYATALR